VLTELHMTLFITFNSDTVTTLKQETHAVAGKPCEAAVNFDMQCLGTIDTSAALHSYTRASHILDLESVDSSINYCA